MEIVTSNVVCQQQMRIEKHAEMRWQHTFNAPTLSPVSLLCFTWPPCRRLGWGTLICRDAAGPNWCACPAAVRLLPSCN
jgi:hypothetical protein